MFAKVAEEAVMVADAEAVDMYEPVEVLPAVTDPETDEEEDEAPVMWNGRENWKISGFASEAILNP